MDTATGVLTKRRRVRVWFGSHVIADYSAAADVADDYVTATERRFAGLKVTVDDELTGDERPMPCERLWAVTPL
jgi:hypothetical protein